LLHVTMFLRMQRHQPPPRMSGHNAIMGRMNHDSHTFTESEPTIPYISECLDERMQGHAPRGYAVNATAVMNVKE
jgi:hypothetical protein